MPPRRLEAPYCFFVDECLGRYDVPEAMAKVLTAGEKVVRSFERFKAGARDDAWLPKVGAEGMVVITKDSRFRFRPNERVALIEANTAVFMVPDTTGPKMAELVVSAMPTMRRVLNRKVPLVGRVLEGGVISLLMVDGEDCNDKRVKPPRR